MFTINDDYNNEELKTSGAIRKSGVYTMKCTRAKIYKSSNTVSYTHLTLPTTERV